MEKISDFPFKPDQVQINKVTNYNFDYDLDEEGNEIRANFTPSTDTEASLTLTVNKEELRKFIRYYKFKKYELESFTLTEETWRNIKNSELISEISSLSNSNWVFSGDYRVEPVISGLYEVNFSIKSIIEEENLFVEPNYEIENLIIQSRISPLPILETEVPIKTIFSININSSLPKLDFTKSIFIKPSYLREFTPVVSAIADIRIRNGVTINSSTPELSPNI